MSWKTFKLGDLVNNFSVRAKDVGGADGLDFFGVSNEEGIIKAKYAAEDKAEDYKIIEKGCFAYNPYRVNVGSIGLVSDDTKGLISPAYVIFKPKPISIIPELLFKFLKSDEGLRQIKFYSRGTVRQALRFEDLCNIEITIPEYGEQKLLYNKLINSQEASNVLDTELKYQLELLKKLRQQLLQDAVQGKLVAQNKNDEPASELLKKIKAEKLKLIAEKKLKKEKELPPIKPEEIPFEIPENWVWCRLGDLCTVEKGLIGIQKAIEGEYPLVVTGEDRLTCNQFHFEGKAIVVPLVSSTGHGHASLKRIHYQEGKFAVGNILACIITFVPSYVNMVFLFNYLDAFKEFFFVEKMKGAANVTLKISSIKETPIPVIPIEIQNKYEELMQSCNELETSIKQSESQNEKLLQQVLREALRKESVEV